MYDQFGGLSRPVQLLCVDTSFFMVVGVNGSTKICLHVEPVLSSTVAEKNSIVLFHVGYVNCVIFKLPSEFPNKARSATEKSVKSSALVMPISDGDKRYFLLNTVE